MITVENVLNDYGEEFADILKKVIHGESLSGDDVRELVGDHPLAWDRSPDSEWKDIVGDSGRWDEFHLGYFNLEGQWYSVCWTQGLTEEQENEYPAQKAQKANVRKAYVEATVYDDKVIPEGKPISKEELVCSALAGRL